MAYAQAVQEIAEPPNEPFTNTTVLLRAVKRGACKQINFLLEQGCNPNVSSGSRNIQPLIMACYIQDQRKQLLIIRSLLLHGADPSLVDVCSRNALMYACALAPKAVIEELLHGADFDLNAIDDNQNSALHFAAITGNVDVVTALTERLVKLQLDISIRNNHFLTPLNTALLNSHTECARVLYNYGALPRFTANQFQSILSAISENKPEIANRLIYRDVADGVKVSIARCITNEEQFETLTRQESRKLLLQLPQGGANFQSKSQSSFSLVTKDRRLCRSRTVSADVPLCPSTVRKNTRESLTKNDGNRTRASTISIFNDLKPQSSLDIYDDLMSRYYSTQSSPLFCPPSKDTADVDSEWVDSIRSLCLPGILHDSPAIPCNGNPTEGVSRLPQKLIRTSSIPRTVSGSKAKLTRMVTSPMF